MTWEFLELKTQRAEANHVLLLDSMKNGPQHRQITGQKGLALWSVLEREAGTACVFQRCLNSVCGPPFSLVWDRPLLEWGSNPHQIR